MNKFLTFLTWLLLLLYLNFIPPISLMAHIAFYLIIFAAIFGTIHSLFNRTRTALFIAIYVIALLLLLQYRQFNPVNLVLVTVLWWLVSRRPNP